MTAAYGISTHILDVALGKPAAGVAVTLEISNPQVAGSWNRLAESATGADGRCTLLTSSEPLQPGAYRLTFLTGPYFTQRAQSTLYPEITLTFSVPAGESKYHIPLLLSPFGYTTYRGS